MEDAKAEEHAQAMVEEHGKTPRDGKVAKVAAQAATEDGRVAKEDAQEMVEEDGKTTQGAKEEAQ